MSKSKFTVRNKGNSFTELLDQEVYPRLFQCLDRAFPEFDWIKRGNKWEANAWPAGFPYPVNHQHPDRLMVYDNAPHWIKLHGHGGVRFVNYLNGGQKPEGETFIRVVRELCNRVGVTFPERQPTAEEAEEACHRETIRTAMEITCAGCSGWLAKHESVQAYLLENRGLKTESFQEFELGYFNPKWDLSQHLNIQHKMDLPVAKSESKRWAKMRGYLTLPWRDENGQILTVYGRWPGDELPLKKDLPGWVNNRDEERSKWSSGPKTTEWVEPRIPKTFALPGENSKASPFLFDRVRRAGHKHIVCVEGVFDALLLQELGETRACAYVAAQFSGEQLKTLQRCRIEAVSLCGDPDGGGDNGTARNVESLAKIGILPYVVPRLPDNTDPDDYVRLHGIEAWRTLVGQARHGYRFLAEKLIKDHGERGAGDDLWIDDLIRKAIKYAKTLPQERPDEITRHFLSVIAEATGATVDDLREQLRHLATDKECNENQNDPNGSQGGKQDGKDASGATQEGYKFEAIDSKTFFTNKYKPRWLVENVLVEGQPGVCGGPKKCLKTTSLMDLAVSLASGTCFLNHFQVFRKHIVLMVSGESGEATLQNTGFRVCRTRNIDPCNLSVHWSFRLPQFCNPADRAVFSEGLRTLGDKGVCILDPLYLALLAGSDTKAVEAGNLYQIGPLLLGIAYDCLKVGWTPILCHHTRKNIDRELIPLDLDDLSFAGIAEFARQWILESRREAYKNGTGSHRLWLKTGGSVGFDNLYAVDVEEGCIGGHVSEGDGAWEEYDPTTSQEGENPREYISFRGRKWDVKVDLGGDVVAQKQEQREIEKEMKKDTTVKRNGTKVLDVYDKLLSQKEHKEGWVGVRLLREETGINTDNLGRALNSLVEEKVLERGEKVAPVGRGLKGKRAVDSVRRTTYNVEGA